MNRLVPLLLLLLLLPFGACLPPGGPVPVLVGASSVATVSGFAPSPAGGDIGTLLEYKIQPDAAIKALKISAWGSSGANLHPKAVYLYVGSDLPIAVNVNEPMRWWRCEVAVVRSAPSAQEYSSVCYVGNLAGDTVSSVHSMQGTQAWSAPIVIRTAGKGVLAGDIVGTGLIVEVGK